VERERGANEKNENTRSPKIVVVGISGGWEFDLGGGEARQARTKTGRGRYSQVGWATSAPERRFLRNSGGETREKCKRERSANEKKSENTRGSKIVVVRISGGWEFDLEGREERQAQAKTGRGRSSQVG
jgi:hypothetical protein